MNNLINLDSINPESIIPADALDKAKSLFTMESLTTLVIPIVVGLVVLKLLTSQVGCIVKLITHAVSGFICLWLVNLAAVYTGITIEINLVTVLISGLLGIPGIILLVLRQFL